MRTSRIALPLLVAALAACASRPSGPPPLEPVGTYLFNTTIDGQAVGGTVEITGSPGAYGGWVRAEGVPPIRITSVTVQGQSMRIAAIGDDGTPIAVDLDFTGDEFTGSWSAGEMGGVLSGRKQS